MRSQVLFSLAGEPYDISNPAIRCRAESDGAKVYQIEGRIGMLRVLDFSEQEAEATYREGADGIDPRCPTFGGSQYSDRYAELCVCDPDEVRGLTHLPGRYPK